MAAYRRRSAKSLDHMSRMCPTCLASILLLCGVDVQASRPSNASWLRYATRHFYCRHCGTKLAYKTSPIGYLLHLAFAAFLIALALFLHGSDPFHPALRLPNTAVILALVSIASVGLIYVLCVGRWGVSWRRAL